MITVHNRTEKLDEGSEKSVKKVRLAYMYYRNRNPLKLYIFGKDVKNPEECTRLEVSSTAGVPRGVGTKRFQSMACNIPN